MSTKEECNELKKERNELHTEVKELSEEELVQVAAGTKEDHSTNGQISAVCIGISDKNGNQKAAANSVPDSFSE